MRICVVAGHVGIERLRVDGLCAGRDIPKLKASTGTRGEREWTGDAAIRVARGLQEIGIPAFTADSSGGDEIRDPLDLVIALHLQRDSSSSRAFCGIPKPGAYISDDARDRAAEWQALFNGSWTGITGIPVTAERGDGANLVDNYLWCYLDETTPAVLLECGHADLDAATLYEPGIRRVVGAIVELTRIWANVAPTIPPPTPPAPAPPSTVAIPVLGASELTTAQLARGIWRFNARARFDIIRLYGELAPIAGIRAEVALAQAAHETGWFTFPRIARPEWKNYCGLGCSEATRECEIFETEELGVRAHLGHVLAYFGEHVPAFCDADPRHDLIGHRRLANDIRELGGLDSEGRIKWAPSPDYGRAVASQLEKIRAANS